MGTLEVLLLAFFLIFLVVILMKMDKSYRAKQHARMEEGRVSSPRSARRKRT